MIKSHILIKIVSFSANYSLINKNLEVYDI